MKVILIGAGNRGRDYVEAGKQHIPNFEVVAVAEINQERKRYIQQMFDLPDENCFDSWEDLLAMPRMADAAIIATMDKLHLATARAAIQKGYDVLLEKPMGATPEEIVQISDAVEARGVKFAICFVLRYAPFFSLVKKIIDRGEIGEIVSVVHMECIGFEHYAHFFVRGEFGNTETSTPLVVQKATHDMDLLQWLIGKKCVKVQSFGGLSHYCAENRPQGAPEYCYQGCPREKDCPYNAVQIYKNDGIPHFVNLILRKNDPKEEEIDTLLKESNFGKCVYACQNDVNDHQTVNLLYENGVTASFTVSAFTRDDRIIRIMGTKGELYGNMYGDGTLSVYDFLSGETKVYKIGDEVNNSKHGGGDLGIVKSFCEYVQGNYKGNAISDANTYAHNHLTCFAAEESRLSGTVVDVDAYTKSIRKKVENK